MTKYFWDEFKEIAEKHPDRPAIIDNNKTTDYKTLIGQAANLGKKLKLDGVTLETPVGLNFDKSTDYIIALLAVWYAGGTFIPMPFCLPEERQSFIKKETSMKHILTKEYIIPPSDMDFNPVKIKDDTLAYIIYTSGSTGKPKGVMVEHRGVLPFIKAQQQVFKTNKNSRYLFYLSIGFDASISDICVALLSGSALIIAPDKELKDAKEFLNLMQTQKITHTDIPPSLLKVISPSDMPDCLETIIIGGEVCPPEIVRKWAKKFRVINVYGPTETTVCTSMVKCSANNWDKPLIGEPMKHVIYKVINNELYIGGNCLARGYLNQPKLTGQKFITIGKKRFYKTGDNVKQHGDGTIEFLGRIDRQFKLRGQLIEPEEIETHLKNHSKINNAVVLKCPLRKNGNDALVAFITGEKSTNIDGFLKEKLPDWMIPQHFELLNKMPETITGKVDYSRLRNLDLTLNNKKHIKPKTSTEKKIFAIWSKLLKHDAFGITDSFFAIGGDSLNAMNFTLEAEKQGLSVSVPLLIEQHILKDLAKAIDNKEENNGSISCEILKQDIAFNNEWLGLFKTASTRTDKYLKQPKNIFITGATGFLGGRLLDELLKETNADIFCLVRDKNKIQSNKRIHFVYGDLTKKYLGINKKQWLNLTEEIDTIYHCAAWVNIVQLYDIMRAVNISGTLEVLRLACIGRRKKIHYASTLSVFVATDRNTGIAMETDKLEKTKYVYGGYAQTKWAAEYMLLQVPKDVCNITHYRFGLITGDSKTGVTSKDDFLTVFIKSIVGEDIAKSNISLDITPIDYATSAMVYLSINGKKNIYHIANKQSLSLEKLLLAIKSRQNLLACKNHAMAKLALCRVNNKFNFHRTMDLFQATDIIFDTKNTDTDYPIACPEITDNLLKTYIDFIFKSNKDDRKAS